MRLESRVRPATFVNRGLWRGLEFEAGRAQGEIGGWEEPSHSVDVTKSSRENTMEWLFLKREREREHINKYKEKKNKGKRKVSLFPFPPPQVRGASGNK